MRYRAMNSLAIVGLVLGIAPLFADDQPKDRPTASRKRGPELPAFSPEREAIALKFVEQHHPELGKVLARLKTTNEQEYRQAIRELSKTTATLAASQDPKYSQLLLEAWKANSRAELLAARLSCITDPAVRLKMEGELKELIYEWYDLQRAIIQNRRQVLLSALEAAEANIKRLQEGRGKLTENLFRALTQIRKKPPQSPEGKK